MTHAQLLTTQDQAEPRASPLRLHQWVCCQTIEAKLSAEVQGQAQGEVEDQDCRSDDQRGEHLIYEFLTVGDGFVRERRHFRLDRKYGAAPTIEMPGNGFFALPRCYPTEFSPPG
jgi:hypothetical protein